MARRPLTITNCSFVGAQIDGDATEACREIAHALRINAEALRVLATSVTGGNVEIGTVMHVEADGIKEQEKP